MNKKKVKLELKQPQFICSGRDPVSCYYKGTIMREEEGKQLIHFKYRGEWIQEWYYNGEGFLTEDIKDIKIKS